MTDYVFLAFSIHDTLLHCMLSTCINYALCVLVCGCLYVSVRMHGCRHVGIGWMVDDGCIDASMHGWLDGCMDA